MKANFKISLWGGIEFGGEVLPVGAWAGESRMEAISSVVSMDLQVRIPKVETVNSARVGGGKPGRIRRIEFVEAA